MEHAHDICGRQHHAELEGELHGVRVGRQRAAFGSRTMRWLTGDMFALPFADASFDTATSFNAIWTGCDGALREARRVLVPGGRLGVTFWGRLEHLGPMPYFSKLIEPSPPSHGEATLRQGETGRLGVAEQMLRSTGFEPGEPGEPVSPVRVRALAAAGPSVPAIEAVGYDVFCKALREVLGRMCVDGLGLQICSEFGWIIAEAV